MRGPLTRLPGLLLSLVSFVAVAAAGEPAAHAADPSKPHPSPYRFRLGLDLPLVGLSLAGASAVLVPPAAPSCLPRCEPPSGMNDLDRRVLGNYSTAAHTAADIVVAALLVVPHAVNLATVDRRSWLEDAALSAEAVLLAQGLTQVVKLASARPAPIVYDEAVPLEERTSRDALRSFWSGHTATAFSAATSFAVSYWIRNPRDPWRWVVLATLESAALAVGLLKLRAGYHYPSDVFAGAALGVSVGVLVPTLHRTF